MELSFARSGSRGGGERKVRVEVRERRWRESNEVGVTFACVLRIAIMNPYSEREMGRKGKSWECGGGGTNVLGCGRWSVVVASVARF